MNIAYKIAEELIKTSKRRKEDGKWSVTTWIAEIVCRVTNI